ncbi:MAG: hypothetical protein AAFY34_08075, partial [Pseudomonadota bacterium]
SFEIIERLASSTYESGLGASISLPRIIMGWLFLFIPLLMFARVLHPSRTSIGGRSSEPFYLRTPLKMTVERYSSELKACDWLDETSAELISVSRLRDLKRRNFLLALWVASAAYTLLFILVTLRGLLSMGG